MKLIIDIPEEVKHKIYAYGLSLSPSDKEQLIRVIMNGTPLEDIKAEIDHDLKDAPYLYDEEHLDELYGFQDGIEHVLHIIDKHIGKGSE